MPEEVARAGDEGAQAPRSACPRPSAEYSMVRTYLDWLIELPWKRRARQAIDIAAGAPDPRRGPLRPREDQAPHPRVPRGAQAQPGGQERRSCASSARPAWARPRSASRSRARSGASSCASRWAACTTRRRSAATGAPTSARCRATSSRRIKQGRQRATACSCSTRSTSSAQRLPRRPVVGAARGARPGAEQHVPRQLPRRAVRPVEGDVHRHGERARHDPGPAARPHGDHPAPRLHARRRSSQIAKRYLVRAPARGERARSRSRSQIGDAALAAIIRDYTREAGVRNLEREIGSVLAARRGAASRRARPRAGADRRAASSPRSSGRARFESGGRRAHRGAGRRDRARLDAGGRRHPVHRGDPDAGQRAS